MADEATRRERLRRWLERRGLPLPPELSPGTAPEAMNAFPQPGLPGVPGLPGAGLPGAGLPGAGLPGAGLPGAGLPGAGLPGAGLPRRPIGGLEAIINLERGPACLVLPDGLAFEPIAAFEHFNTAPHADAIRRAIVAVGRIDVIAHGPVGTGWLVGPGLVCTNRHVARLFSNGEGLQGLALRQGLRVVVDFRQEHAPEPASEPVEVIGVRLIHPYWDIALLELARHPADREPMKLLPTQPDALPGQDVAVVGFPMYDSSLDPAIATQVFKGIYARKRVGPGRIIGVEDVSVDDGPTTPALQHDAPTLGGSSGSLTLWLGRKADGSPMPGFGTAIGLHFAGYPFVANHAVPAWALAEDALVRKAARGQLAVLGESAPVVVTTPTIEGARVEADCEAADGPPPQRTSGTELSGEAWAARYPESRDLTSLAEPFQGRARQFVAALREGGVTVNVGAAWKPAERGWMAYWARRVADGDLGPGSVPAFPGLPIRWEHPTLEASRAAAAAMRKALGSSGPRLGSRHTQGTAVDLEISWTTETSVRTASGETRPLPLLDDGGHAALAKIAATYGLTRHATDPHHWSDDGS